MADARPTGRKNQHAAYARKASIASVVFLVAALGVLLPREGFTPTRLGLFVLVAVVGVVGAYGAREAHVGLMGASAAGLFLLGFWQFTVGLFALPASFLLAVAAIFSRE